MTDAETIAFLRGRIVALEAEITWLRANAMQTRTIPAPTSPAPVPWMPSTTPPWGPTICSASLDACTVQSKGPASMAWN